MIKIRFVTLVHLCHGLTDMVNHTHRKQVESKGALIPARKIFCPPPIFLWAMHFENKLKEQRREKGLWKRDDLHCIMYKSKAVYLPSLFCHPGGDDGSV